MKFEDRNIFNDINRNSGNLQLSTTSTVWADILTLPLEILKLKIMKNNMNIKDYLDRLKDYTGKTFKDLAQKSNFKESYLKDIFTTNGNRRRECLIETA